MQIDHSTLDPDFQIEDSLSVETITMLLNEDSEAKNLDSNGYSIQKQRLLYLSNGAIESLSFKAAVTDSAI
jgi:hypothetical protein